MAVSTEASTIFTQGGGRALYVAVPDGQSVTISSSGDTLYYKTTSDVTSSSNDGSIATGASASFTVGQYVICATGVNTTVITKTTEGDGGNWRVGGALTTVGAQTISGGLSGGVPYNVSTWQPIAATSGTDTACSNGTAYVGSVFVPMNCTVTGIQYLIGSVGGTDKVVASLHTAAGVPVANSATAGATVGTAANIQQVAFTATYAAKGPAFYFVALTFNGTTAKFRSIPAFCGAGTVGNGVTQTFGTVASFTSPSTLTADKAPVASLYA